MRSGLFLSAMLTGRLRGTQAALNVNRGSVPRPGTAHARTSQESTTAKLAKFFPEATPVRIPVQLTRVAGEGKAFSETTVIEFGTPHEVLFASSLPLEFADTLRLRNSDGTLDAEACVVAVQYNSGRTAVAARFTQEVRNWIVKS
jgi:hypothetical protein